jgi:hypothetical protein
MSQPISIEHALAILQRSLAAHFGKVGSWVRIGLGRDEEMRMPFPIRSLEEYGAEQNPEARQGPK